MENQLFRKKSLDRVSSPEQLNDYIRVSSPGVWMVLAAIIVLLAGVCVWGVFGNLETVADTVAVSRDGQVICYVKKADTATVSVGTTVKIGGEEHLVTQLATAPVAAIDELLPYGMAIGGFEGWDLAYEAVLDGTLPDGTYPAKVVLERVAPMSFLWG